MTGPSLTDESALADLLLRWQRLRAEGREVPLAQQCADRPDLLPELQRRIADWQAQDALPKHAADTLDLPPADRPQVTTLAEEKRDSLRYCMECQRIDGNSKHIHSGQRRPMVAPERPLPSLGDNCQETKMRLRDRLVASSWAG
jgi:hypothetical protein